MTVTLKLTQKGIEWSAEQWIYVDRSPGFPPKMGILTGKSRFFKSTKNRESKCIFKDQNVGKIEKRVRISPYSETSRQFPSL